MKGVVIFDERADMAFFSVDKELEEFILGRMQELEMELTGGTVSPFLSCMCVQAFHSSPPCAVR
jgi:hypothetical protein